MSKSYGKREVGRRLRLARLALGLTEKEAAKACRVTLRTYRGWEAGARPMSATSEFKLIEFACDHDVSLDWLFRDDPRRLGRHLTKNLGGKLAILPLFTHEERRHA